MSKKLSMLSAIIIIIAFPAFAFAQTNSTTPTTNTTSISPSPTVRQTIKEDKIPSGSLVEKPSGLSVLESKCSASYTEANMTFSWRHPTASKFKIGWRTESQTTIRNWFIPTNPTLSGPGDWVLTYPGFTPGVKIAQWGVIAIENEYESVPKIDSTPNLANICDSSPTQVLSPIYTINTLEQPSEEIVKPSNLSVTDSKCNADKNQANITFNWSHPTASKFKIGWRTSAQSEITNYFTADAHELIIDQINTEGPRYWTFTYPDFKPEVSGFTPGVTLEEWAVIAVDNDNSSLPTSSGGTITANTCSPEPQDPSPTPTDQPSSEVTPPSNLTVDTNLECSGYQSSKVKFNWEYPNLFEFGTTFKIAWSKDDQGNWEYIPAVAVQKKFLGLPTKNWHFTYDGFNTGGQPIPEWVVVTIKDGKESFATHDYNFTPKDCSNFNPPKETLTLDPTLQMPDSVDVTETEYVSYNNTSVTFAWHQKPDTASSFQIGWSLTPNELEYYTPPGIINDGNGNYHVKVDGFNTYGDPISYWGVRAINASNYSQTKLGAPFIPEDSSPFNTKPRDPKTECCPGPIYDVNENTISTIEDLRSFSSTSIGEIQSELTISPTSPLSWLNVFNYLAPGILLRNALRQNQSESDLAIFAVVNSWAQKGYSVSKIQEFYSQFTSEHGRLNYEGLQYLDEKFFEGKLENYLNCYFKEKRTNMCKDVPPGTDAGFMPIGGVRSFDDIIKRNSLIADLLKDYSGKQAAAVSLEQTLIENMKGGSIGNILNNLATYDAESRQFLDTNDSLGNTYIAMAKRLKGRADETAKDPLSYVVHNLHGQVTETAQKELDSLNSFRRTLSVFSKDFAVGFISVDAISPASKVFKATVVASVAGRLGKNENALKALSQKLLKRGIVELNDSEREDFLKITSKYATKEVVEEAEKIRLINYYSRIAKNVKNLSKEVMNSKNFDELYATLNKIGPVALHFGGESVTSTELIYRINKARKVYIGDSWDGVNESTFDPDLLGTEHGIAETVHKLIRKEIDSILELSQDAVKANSFKELYDAIKKAGIIHGSDGITAYSPDELIRIIEDSITTNNLQKITRMGELRYQVKRLIRQIPKIKAKHDNYERNSYYGFGNIFREEGQFVERAVQNGDNMGEIVVVSEADDILYEFAQKANNIDNPVERIEKLSREAKELGYAKPFNGDPELFLAKFADKTYPIGHFIKNGSICFEKAIMVKAAIDLLTLNEGRNDIQTRMVAGKSDRIACRQHMWLEVLIGGSNQLLHIDPTWGDLLKVERSKDVYDRLGRIPEIIFN